MKRFWFVFILPLWLTACNKEKESNNNLNLSQPEEAATSTIEAAMSSSLPTSYASAEVQNIASSAPKGRINPAHGEPGHLCEYEVGAIIPVEETPVAPAGSRINPAHGEPGHLCEYEVGAIIPEHINGALPQPVNPEVVVNRPMPITPQATSILSRPLNTVVPTGPKPQFNPEHGQPWHTCDLPVGAPLS